MPVQDVQDVQDVQRCPGCKACPSCLGCPGAPTLENHTTNLQKAIQNPFKNLPKSSPNPPQILPKSIQNSLLEPSWAVLPASWAILAPRGHQERNKTEKPELGPLLRASILGRFSSYVGTMLGHVALQERMVSTSCELVHQGLYFTRQLGSTWTQVGPT